MPPPGHRLPGDPLRTAAIRRMIRVDQAGEAGATHIYDGQLAVLRSGPGAEAIRGMAAQERAHREQFDALLGRRQVRPTILAPLWRAAGWTLGAVTAALGERAAMACTAAVEDVICAHYQAQAETLGTADPELSELIGSAERDEAHHRDIALAHEAERAPAYLPMTAAIKLGTRLAIWLSSRL